MGWLGSRAVTYQNCHQHTALGRQKQLSFSMTHISSKVLQSMICSIAGISKLWPAGFGPLPVIKFYGTQPCPFVYVLSVVAFAL